MGLGGLDFKLDFHLNTHNTILIQNFKSNLAIIKSCFLSALLLSHDAYVCGGGTRCTCTVMNCTVVPCTLYELYYCIPYTIYTIYHIVPCTMHHAPCTMHHAPCTMHHAPCTMHHALVQNYLEVLPTS
jgi:hypothetical protein